MKAEKSTPKPARHAGSPKPSTSKRDKGQCSPTPTTNQPGGRRGEACPEGYPEVQPTDVPDTTKPSTPKHKQKPGKPTA